MNKPLQIFSILLVSLSLSWPTFGQESDSTIAIFRYAELGPPGRITLGEPLELQGNFGIYEANTIVRIPMSYPGTAWMKVFTDSTERVGAMYFSYNAAFDFEKSLANYTEDLGTPEQELVESREEEVYFWQDEQTRFELVRRMGSRGVQHFSILRDLELSSSTLLPNIAELGTDSVSLSVADILATTEIWSIVGGKPVELIDLIRAARPDLHPDTLSIVGTVIEERYSPLSLYNHVRRDMEEHSDGITVVNLTDWLFDEKAIKLRATVDVYKPTLALEEYAASLSDSPPSPERVNLLMRFVRANHVGEFFLGLDTATRNAGNKILASLPGESTLLSPPSEEEIAKMSENYDLFALVSFLWRFEPLTNDEILQIVMWYESASGQWFVKRYSEAVASALKGAGEQVATEISDLH